MSASEEATINKHKKAYLKGAAVQLQLQGVEKEAAQEKLTKLAKIHDSYVTSRQKIREAFSA